MSVQETWLVLGASSAIARAFARVAATAGADVILAGRDLEDLEHTAADLRIRTQVKVGVVSFDALNFDSHAVLVEQVTSRARHPLSVFLAFGVMAEQSEIDADFAAGLQTINGTYTGAVSVLAHLAASLENQRGGHVIALGSVAGDRGRIKNYVYGSAKAGLHAYLQGLRARLFRAGVSVTTVKPGFVDTAMTYGLEGMFLVAAPDDVAKTCWRRGRRGAEEIYVPWFWWGIMVIIRNIPEFIFKRLNI
ncbi:MAG: SDR family oxidoreductase [Geminicoccaceae bacterium]